MGVCRTLLVLAGLTSDGLCASCAMASWDLGSGQRGVRRQCWWPCRSPLVACAAGLMRSRAASTHFLRPPWPETGRGARVDVRANDWREYALNNNSTLVETNEFRHRTRCVCSTCSMTSSRPGLHAR